MNTLQRLKDLEAKIFAADGHEGRKYYHQMQEELYLAWPEILALVEAADKFVTVRESGRYANYEYNEMIKALAALQEDK